MAEKPPGKPPEPPKKSSAPKLAAKALTDNAASPQGVSAASPQAVTAEGCKQLDKVNSTGPGTVYCIKRPGHLCPGACALG